MVNEIKYYPLDINKYKNDGWGLSRKEFDLIYNEIIKKNGDLNIYNVVEFGSGRSTEFLIDVKSLLLSPDIKIYSFDDSIEYSYKGNNKDLTLNIVPLVDTDDVSFEDMFLNKKYDHTKMKDKNTPINTRQKNCFYKIDETMLPENIDLLILDGPHGNGRSIAFLHCLNKFKCGTIILIDDANHYPFHEYLKKLFLTEIIYEQNVKGDKWNNGGDFILLKIICKI
jgi:hypothetical protein